MLRRLLRRRAECRSLVVEAEEGNEDKNPWGKLTSALHPSKTVDLVSSLLPDAAVSHCPPGSSAARVLAKFSKAISSHVPLLVLVYCGSSNGSHMLLAGDTLHVNKLLDAWQEHRQAGQRLLLLLFCPHASTMLSQVSGLHEEWAAQAVDTGTGATKMTPVQALSCYWSQQRDSQASAPGPQYAYKCAWSAGLLANVGVTLRFLGPQMGTSALLPLMDAGSSEPPSGSTLPITTTGSSSMAAGAMSSSGQVSAPEVKAMFGMPATAEEPGLPEQGRAEPAALQPGIDKAARDPGDTGPSATPDRSVVLNNPTLVKPVMSDRPPESPSEDRPSPPLALGWDSNAGRWNEVHHPSQPGPARPQTTEPHCGDSTEHAPDALEMLSGSPMVGTPVQGISNMSNFSSDLMALLPTSAVNTDRLTGSLVRTLSGNLRAQAAAPSGGGPARPSRTLAGAGQDNAPVRRTISKVSFAADPPSARRPRVAPGSLNPASTLALLQGLESASGSSVASCASQKLMNRVLFALNASSTSRSTRTGGRASFQDGDDVSSGFFSDDSSRWALLHQVVAEDRELQQELNQHQPIIPTRSTALRMLARSATATGTGTSASLTPHSPGQGSTSSHSLLSLLQGTRSRQGRSLMDVASYRLALRVLQPSEPSDSTAQMSSVGIMSRGTGADLADLRQFSSEDDKWDYLKRTVAGDPELEQEVAVLQPRRHTASTSRASSPAGSPGTMLLNTQDADYQSSPQAPHRPASQTRLLQPQAPTSLGPTAAHSSEAADRLVQATIASALAMRSMATCDSPPPMQQRSVGIMRQHTTEDLETLWSDGTSPVVHVGAVGGGRGGRASSAPRSRHEESSPGLYVSMAETRLDTLLGTPRSWGSSRTPSLGFMDRGTPTSLSTAPHSATHSRLSEAHGTLSPPAGPGGPTTG